MEWKETLRTGVDEFDEMHIAMFENISTILRKLSSCRTATDYRKSIGDIRHEFIELFTYQESRMLMQKYAQYYQHKHNHEQFIDKLNAIYNQMEGDYFGFTSAQIDNMMTDWAMKHIFMYDKLWAKFTLAEKKK